MNTICNGCPGVLHLSECEDCPAAEWNQPERDDYDEDAWDDWGEEEGGIK